MHDSEWGHNERIDLVSLWQTSTDIIALTTFITAYLTGSLLFLRLSFAELKAFFVFCSGKSGITVINPDQKMTNHSGNNCGLINPQQLNSNYAWCCSILWNMMQFGAEHTVPQSCVAKLLLHTCISPSLYCSSPWVAEHVWVLTLNMFSAQQQNPRNPTPRKMTAHSPAHTSVKFQLLLDCVAVCCQSACLRREWFAVEKHEGHVHPPGC